MQTLETIYTFRTRNFCVKVEALPEYEPDLSFDESGETAEMIERGDWLCFSVRASLSSHNSDIAEDYLGNCIYENFSDFRDNIGIGKHKGCGSYFSDMVRQVIKEGRENMANTPTLRKK
jgi:hypothetical protein